MSPHRPMLASCVLAVLAALTVSLSAHLAVLKTLPADGTTVAGAPETVQVWFSQPPSLRVSRLDMSGPEGEVPLGELQIDSEERSLSARVEGALAAGTYEVAWRTAGDDGHVQRGTFRFVLHSTE